MSQHYDSVNERKFFAEDEAPEHSVTQDPLKAHAKVYKSVRSEFLKVLKKETLERCIIDVYDAWAITPTENLSYELRSLLFQYLKDHTITREVAYVCKIMIQKPDLDTLQNINEYNYNKLKLIL